MRQIFEPVEESRRLIGMLRYKKPWRKSNGVSYRDEVVLLNKVI